MLLLPSGYSTSGMNIRFPLYPPLLTSSILVSYPLVLYLHQNDMGTGYYQGNDLLQGQINPWFNNDQFRRNNPCIIVAPLLDQVIPSSIPHSLLILLTSRQSADLSGNTINFGGYGSGDPTQGEQKSVAIAQVFYLRPSPFPLRSDPSSFAPSLVFTIC